MGQRSRRLKQEKTETIHIPVPVIIGLAFCVGVYFIYMLVNDDIYFNAVNILSYCLSITLVFAGIIDLKEEGINLYNTFLIAFFSCLALNNLNISRLQEPKTMIDIYYFFFGPLLFAAILYLGRKPPGSKLFFKVRINPELIAAVLLIAFIILKVSVLSQTGIRLLSDSWEWENNSKFYIPGASGLAQMCMWLLLILLPLVRKKMMFIVTSAVVIFVFLNGFRAEIMQTGIFLIIVWVESCGPNFLTKKNIIRFCIVILALLIVFTAMGNYRQAKRGWDDPGSEIGMKLESRTDNEIVNWVFSYTGLNFDCLKQIEIGREPSYEFKTLTVPVMRLTEGSEAVRAYELGRMTEGLNGFNAVTFLGVFIEEAGALYFLEIIILALLVVLLDKLCGMTGCRGGRILLMMCTALTLFGNYYTTVVNLCYSLIVGIFMHCFINTKAANESGKH